MRTIMAPVFWLGRVLLWIFVFPIGVWRSLRHHRKKGVREMKRELAKAEKRRGGEEH